MTSEQVVEWTLMYESSEATLQLPAPLTDRGDPEPETIRSLLSSAQSAQNQSSLYRKYTKDHRGRSLENRAETDRSSLIPCIQYTLTPFPELVRELDIEDRVFVTIPMNMIDPTVGNIKTFAEQKQGRRTSLRT